MDIILFCDFSCALVEAAHYLYDHSSSLDSGVVAKLNFSLKVFIFLLFEFCDVFQHAF